jgi:hypothetical protein
MRVKEVTALGWFYAYDFYNIIFKIYVVQVRALMTLFYGTKFRLMH